MSRILYKYLDIVGAKSMIGNRNLQFTNASQLNDPFDCHPKLIDYSNVTNTKRQGWIKIGDISSSNFSAISLLSGMAIVLCFKWSCVICPIVVFLASAIFLNTST